MRFGRTVAAAWCALAVAAVGACSASKPPSSATSALYGTTQVAVLVGYDATTRVVTFSPTVPGGALAPTYKLPLASDPTVVLAGSAHGTVDQLMAHSQASDPVGARLTIDPYGQITQITQLTR